MRKKIVTENLQQETEECEDIKFVLDVIVGWDEGVGRSRTSG